VVVTSTAAVEARDVYRFYHAADDETLALRGVTLRVAAGELVAVTGPSGSGKSTLLHCLAGLDDVDGGTVVVAGQRVSHRPEGVRAAIRARHLGILFQTDNLLEHLDVAGNVAFSARLGGRPPGAAVAAVLAELGIAHLARSRPTTLSGGEAARAGFAAALANDPTVLLADEPTGELDSATAAGVIGALRRRAEGGTAVLVATHDLEVAGRADRVLELVDGQLQR
jgi:putative ABC transport system ATP-binding protein